MRSNERDANSFCIPQQTTHPDVFNQACREGTRICLKMCGLFFPRGSHFGGSDYGEQRPI